MNVVELRNFSQASHQFVKNGEGIVEILASLSTILSEQMGEPVKLVIVRDPK